MNQWLILKKEVSFDAKLSLLTASFFIILLYFSTNVDGVPIDPHQQVKQTTDKIFTLLQTGLDPVKFPDEFIKELSDILNSVIAFDYIAKGVMGIYARQASSEQVKQFSASFKKGLVYTYGQGVSSFKGLTINVLPPIEPLSGRRRIKVIQEIRGSSNITKISYDMRKTSQGRWKMFNFILNGINFGQIFRSQFAAAVKKNNGDLDKTIQEWAKKGV